MIDDHQNDQNPDQDHQRNRIPDENDVVIPHRILRVHHLQNLRDQDIGEIVVGEVFLILHVIEGDDR